MTVAKPASESVRTRRLEVIDDNDRVRAVIGALPSPDPTMPVFGVVILDDEGRHRAWFSMDPTGPKLVFDLDGNDVLSLGVHDDREDALRVGAFAILTDPAGTPLHELPKTELRTLRPLEPQARRRRRWIRR